MPGPIAVLLACAVPVVALSVAFIWGPSLVRKGLAFFRKSQKKHVP